MLAWGTAGATAASVCTPCIPGTYSNSTGQCSVSLGLLSLYLSHCCSRCRRVKWCEGDGTTHPTRPEVGVLNCRDRHKDRGNGKEGKRYICSCNKRHVLVGPKYAAVLMCVMRVWRCLCRSNNIDSTRE
jgi:hypothetical protein